MRKLLLAVVALAVAGLVFFLLWSPGTPSPTGGGQDSGPKQAQAPVAPGRPLENPEDIGARGSADAGSTPTLAKAPSEQDGVLEVEVVARDKPVPGASARLYWRGARDPNLDQVAWRLASTGITDAQGHARLASGPGSYQVAVRAPGYASLLRDVVRPVGQARTELRLELEPGARLTGRTVEEGSQEPLPLVDLVLTAYGHKPELWQRAEAPAEERIYTSSDERGSFLVEGLAPGEYQLEAVAPGHSRAVLHSVKVPATAPLTVSLLAASVLEGFVVDAKGSPAAGAEVQVGGRMAETATTGPGGGFSVEVEPGEHTVSARRNGEAGALEGIVTVGAGKTVRDIRIQLGPSAVLEGHVVTRATGAPISGASVDVSPYGNSGDSGRAVTDATGQFSVGGLAPGSYDVAVSAQGFAHLNRRALTVGSGERFPVELQLSATGAVEGQVKDAAGQPVQGAQVRGGSRWVGGADEAAESRADAEGRYRLEGLPSGMMSVTARRPGATVGTNQLVEVTEGGTAQADFTLEETGTVEGVVHGAGGGPPTDSLLAMAVPVGAEYSGSADYRPIEVEPAGTFRMTLPPGFYEVRVMLAEQGSYSGKESSAVDVEAGKTAHVEVNWRREEHRGEGLQGVVLEADGTPSPGAYVLVSVGEEADFPWVAASTNGLGHFSLALSDKVAEAAAGNSGRLTLVARNGGRLGELAGVKPGEQHLVVKLRPSASVKGRVVRASGGAPVQGFTITLQSQQVQLFPFGNGSWEFPGERFELQDVPAESLRVLVRTTDGAAGMVLATPAAGQSTSLEISVKGTAGIRGRVLDRATQEPMPGVYTLVEGDRPLDPDKVTGTDGRFTVEGAAPGAHSLLVVRGKEYVRHPVTLVEGQVTDVGDIELGDY
jgi:hypothetical protein